jgi:hypothetical protein
MTITVMTAACLCLLLATARLATAQYTRQTGRLAQAFFRRLRPATAFRFFEEDDSDIKIVGQEKAKNADDDPLRAASELDYQRGCGNLEKAKTLGALLSQKLISEDGESNFGADADEDGATRVQRRLLLAFSVISTVESDIKSPVLQGVVLNVFYTTLKADLPEFYDDINETGAFSFYTLCFRRGGDVADSVGHTFGMLVGREGDAVTKELGKALYLRFVDITLKTIGSFQFK